MEYWSDGVLVGDLVMLNYFEVWKRTCLLSFAGASPGPERV